MKISALAIVTVALVFVASSAPSSASGPPGCTHPAGVQSLRFSAAKYPDVKAHMLAAIASGWPRTMVVNRKGAAARSARLVAHFAVKAGYDRGEYPAAIGRGRADGRMRSLVRGTNPVGWQADFAYIPSSENRAYNIALTTMLHRFCDGTRFRYVFTGSAATPTPPPTAKTTPPAPAKPPGAIVGNTVVLTGNNPGEKIATTLLGIFDPVQGAEYSDPPAAGTRFLGAQIRLANVGTSTYDDSPGNGATLIVAGDTQATSAFISGGPCDSQFATRATISPGTSQVGCIPFDAPIGKAPIRFQFTLDSGFGPATGEWTIGP